MFNLYEIKCTCEVKFKCTKRVLLKKKKIFKKIMLPNKMYVLFLLNC